MLPLLGLASLYLDTVSPISLTLAAFGGPELEIEQTETITNQMELDWRRHEMQMPNLRRPLRIRVLSSHCWLSLCSGRLRAHARSLHRLARAPWREVAQLNRYIGKRNSLSADRPLSQWRLRLTSLGSVLDFSKLLPPFLLCAN